MKRCLTCGERVRFNLGKWTHGSLRKDKDHAPIIETEGERNAPRRHKW